MNIKFPSNYPHSPHSPHSPPSIYFVTQIWHPNVDPKSGYVCLDILANNWSAALKTPGVLLSLISLLTDPNAEDPLNSNAGDMYMKREDEYNEKVIEYVNTYATSDLNSN